jgi:hypothetical protein
MVEGVDVRDVGTPRIHWGSAALCAATLLGCPAASTRPGDGAAVMATAAPSAATAAPGSTATAAASARSPSAPATPAGVSSACAACDAKPHSMCSEQTEGECVDACLQGWAKVGMTHCGKICSRDADCGADKGPCKADMASNAGIKVCEAGWMGLGNHVAR